MKQKRELSPHAAAAKAIRQELKKAFPGIKFRVTSSCFSMGNAVDIYWDNGPTTEQVDDITGKYQYGHFNGMEDIYEYSNKNPDLPQAKYVHCQRDLTDEMFTECFEYIKKHFAGCDHLQSLGETDRELMEHWRAWTPRELIARYLHKIDLSNGVDVEAIFSC